jgi:RNA-directed DNA polymerase
MNQTTISTVAEDFLSSTNFKLAWQKVAENQGSAGVDNQTIADFYQDVDNNLMKLRGSIAQSNYQPLPYKQVWIPKAPGKLRELRIPAIKDRIVQQALLNVINPLIDSQFNAASFGYRPRLSYINAVERVAHYRDLGYQWVLDADIEKFFDNIDHQILLTQLRQYIEEPGILCLIKAWLSAGIQTDDGVIFPAKGIPQGAVVSPLLANIYLNQFDWALSNSCSKLVRYADDFVVLSLTQTDTEQACIQVAQLLNDLDLKLHQTKTKITNFTRGFRFLGHGFLDTAIFPLESPQDLKSKGKKKQHLPFKKSKTRSRW